MSSFGAAGDDDGATVIPGDGLRRSGFVLRDISVEKLVIEWRRRVIGPLCRIAQKRESKRKYSTAASYFGASTSR